MEEDLTKNGRKLRPKLKTTSPKMEDDFNHTNEDDKKMKMTNILRGDSEQPELISSLGLVFSLNAISVTIHQIHEQDSISSLAKPNIVLFNFNF